MGCWPTVPHRLFPKPASGFTHFGSMRPASSDVPKIWKTGLQAGRRPYLLRGRKRDRESFPSVDPANGFFAGRGSGTGSVGAGRRQRSGPPVSPAIGRPGKDPGDPDAGTGLSGMAPLPCRLAICLRLITDIGAAKMDGRRGRPVTGTGGRGPGARRAGRTDRIASPPR